MAHVAPLSDVEIAEKCKAWGFGAYLQTEWFVYSRLKMELAEGVQPTKAGLIEIADRMYCKKLSFDHCYFYRLPNFPTNPLEAEQAVWKALSPRIESFLKEFQAFIESYPSGEAWREELVRHIETWWGLLQKWNEISNSYKQLYS
jgi:hypothetical protein